MKRKRTATEVEEESEVRHWLTPERGTGGGDEFLFGPPVVCTQTPKSRKDIMRELVVKSKQMKVRPVLFEKGVDLRKLVSLWLSMSGSRIRGKRRS